LLQKAGDVIKDVVHDLPQMTSNFMSTKIWTKPDHGLMQQASEMNFSHAQGKMQSSVNPRH
jgi:hypothetical protein